MTKHAVLALTRSVGPVLYATDGIAVNCIMPAYVATSLTPKEVTDLYPKEWLTPIETVRSPSCRLRMTVQLSQSST
jgi:15-hydroxyprostaglandin dehydrogenase (NAD)